MNHIALILTPAEHETVVSSLARAQSSWGQQADECGDTATGRHYATIAADAYGLWDRLKTDQAKREAADRPEVVADLKAAARAVLFCLDSPLKSDVRPLMAAEIATLRDLIEKA